MITCISYEWAPSLGDAGPLGWAVLALYVFAAGLCLLEAAACLKRADRRSASERYFWLGALVLIVLTAAAREFDLAGAVSAAGRCLAINQGWYGERRLVQAAFILVLILVAAVAALAVWKAGGMLKRLWLPVSGLLMLVVFSFARSASDHYLDALVGENLLGVKLAWLLQILALGFVIAGALINRRSQDGAVT